MSEFSVRDDWPGPSWSMFEAVFELTRSPFSKEVLGLWLAPWRENAAGERVSAGELDSDVFVLAESMVDFEKRQFRYQWCRRDDEAGRNGKARSGISIAPPSLSAFIDDPLLLPSRMLSDEGREVLKSKAAFVWSMMVDELFDRLAAGSATIYARVRSPLEAQITVIPPDVWAHFEVEDWANGVAVCKASEDRLFSLRVEFTGGADAPDPFDALSQEFERRRNAGEPPLTTDETVAWAKERNLGRQWARNFRRTLPPDSLLKSGEKRRDRLKKPPTA